MDINLEEAIVEEADEAVKNGGSEIFTEFKKYYRSTAETAAILEELGLPGLEVLRPQDNVNDTSKAALSTEFLSPNNKSEEDNVHNEQSSHKPPVRKEKKGRRRRGKSFRQNAKVDMKKNKPDGLIILLEDNDKKVHDLADSLQDELAEIVISDRMFNDNNNQNHKTQQPAEQSDYEPQNETRKMVGNENNLDNLFIEDIPSNEKLKYRGYPAFVYKDIDKCVIVEDWHMKTLKSRLTSLLHIELSKYGVVSKFGIPDKYASIQHLDMFYVPAYFSTKEAAAKAIEAGSVVIESVSHSVTKPLPLTETSVVIRVNGSLDKRRLAQLFKECGRIRKIKHFYLGKTSTSVIVFGDAESAERAMSFNNELEVSRYVERSSTINHTTSTINSTSNTNNINKKPKKPKHKNKKTVAATELPPNIG